MKTKSTPITALLLAIFAIGLANLPCMARAASPQKTIVLYDPLLRAASLAGELERGGWTVSVDNTPAGADLGKLLKGRPKALAIWCPEGNDLSADVWSREVAAYVRKGGIVFISSHGEINLRSYFPDEDCAVRWSGWEIDQERKSTFVKEGSWRRTPNNMEKIYSEGISPSSGYEPDSIKWDILAKMRMADGSEFAYLLTRPYGNGRIILTSSDLGMSGGYEMFGSDNLPQAAMLINQFLQ